MHPCPLAMTRVPFSTPRHSSDIPPCNNVEDSTGQYRKLEVVFTGSFSMLNGDGDFKLMESDRLHEIDKSAAGVRIILKHSESGYAIEHSR